MAEVIDSVLNTVKKMLGLGSDFKAFDTDVIIHINSTFATLNQLGVGPEEGFMITDETESWLDYTQGQLNMNSVRTYVYLKVRLLFDPPATSFAIAAFEKSAAELEWRLNIQQEGVRLAWEKQQTIS